MFPCGFILISISDSPEVAFWEVILRGSAIIRFLMRSLKLPTDARGHFSGYAVSQASGNNCCSICRSKNFHPQSTGTRSLSSSNQCRTMLILRGFSDVDGHSPSQVALPSGIDCRWAGIHIGTVSVSSWRVNGVGILR